MKGEAMTFEEWWEKEGEISKDSWAPDMKTLRRIWSQKVWDAALKHSDEVHELRGKYNDVLSPTDEPEEPTPTEMVRRLLEKGWTIEQDDDDVGTVFRGPDGVYGTVVISEAYRKAFPPKQRVEVEVWRSPGGRVRDGFYYNELMPDDKTIPWTKSTAVFWVEDK